jgi:hypothetical protein
MKHARLRSFVIAIIFAMLGLIGLAPLTSAHTATPQQQMGYDPNTPCGTMPTGIQMTSGTTGEIVPVPTTSISVDPCTLSYLLSKGDLAKVTVQTDGSIPAAFVTVFKQAVVSHARDLWNKDQTCPNPEDGVFCFL